jgi:hypothetical protein
MTTELYELQEIRQSEDYKGLTSYLAVAIAEGFCEGEGASQQQQQAAWQWLHDTRTAYSLQGWFGRTATQLIEEGIINP